jgi:hypothetical protein
VAKPSNVLEALDRNGVGVRVIFEHEGEGFGHAIYGVRGERSTRLIESVESSSDPAWPMSPPLQQLHVQDDPIHGKLLLLTGSAGRSHWSVSVSVAAIPPSPSDFDQSTKPCLAFDVATRIKDLPSLLGSTYDVCEGATWWDIELLSSAHKAPFGAAVSAALNGPMIEPEILRITTSPDNPSRRTFAPLQVDATNLPTTFRWRYWVWFSNI